MATDGNQLFLGGDFTTVNGNNQQGFAIFPAKPDSVYPSNPTTALPGAASRRHSAGGVPDAGTLIRSYADDRSYLGQLHPGRPTALLSVQELFYWHRHCAMFDVETLGLFFRAAGFPDPRQREFGDTDLEQAPDTERRRAETLYMEARKPTGQNGSAVLPA